MTTISIKISEKLVRRLDAKARRIGVGRSVLVRDAIERILSLEDDSVPQESFLALCREFVGCVDGPPDLSYSKRHMEGFGKSR
jgi:hypothetical protein